MIDEFLNGLAIIVLLAVVALGISARKDLERRVGVLERAVLEASQ